MMIDDFIDGLVSMFEIGLFKTVEKNKEVLLKQVSRETMQIVTKELN